MSDEEYEYVNSEDCSPWVRSEHFPMSSVSSIPRQVTISERAKARVRAVDPNGGRCLVENCPESRAVNFCHCFLQGSTEDDKLLSNIEWHWNMRRYSLNLDSHFNIFRVGASLHRLYDKHFWLLLPEDDIIMRYHATIIKQGYKNYVSRESFPIIPNRNDFKYRFLALSHKMYQFLLLRQNDMPSTVDDYLSPNDMSMHTCPFKDLSILTSHIHPKFALLEAGRKLIVLASHDSGRYNMIVYDRFPILVKVMHLWFAWTRQRPPDALDDNTYKPREIDAASDYNAIRVEEGECESRKRRRLEDSCSRMKHGRDSPSKIREELLPLTAESLRRHSRKLGRRSWTKDAVHHWSAQTISLPARDHKPWKANLIRLIATTF